ncbi:hypothetical protein [Bradyrhizobium zhanjiangense]|uniref:hypothetical protein n=1 Tax=Bradyrhizobium zhanjiangense TaxID=1325107 RepID=UPI001009EA1C|nr:hypothetical protein [Bradyrhizobium zhanjiangense]
MEFKAEGLLTCLILHVVRLEPPAHHDALCTLATLPPDSSSGATRHHRERGRARHENWPAVSSPWKAARIPQRAVQRGEGHPRLVLGKPRRRDQHHPHFHLAELVSEVSTIYLTVGEEKLTVYAGFLRVMVGWVINALTRGKHLPRPMCSMTRLPWAAFSRSGAE